MDYDSSFMQALLCIIASGSMISSGMHVAFSAVALPAINASTNSSLNHLNDTTADLHNQQALWIANLPQLSMIMGCICAGPLLDWKGRRFGLLMSTLLASIGWLLMSVLADLGSLYMSRLLTGFAMGVANPATTVFVSEVASPSTRSALTTIKGIAFSLGLTLTYFFGYLFRTDWRMVAMLCGVFPTCCFLLVLAYAKEPKIWKGTPRLRLVNFRRPQVIKPMMILSVAFMLRQISGTSAMLSYAVELVKQAGVDADEYLVAVALGIARMLGGLLAIWLNSRLGRRLPANWSGVAMSASMLALASTFPLPAYALIMYIITSSIHGVAPQAMVAEVFPTDVRGIASSITTMVMYLTTFVALFIHQWLRLEERSVIFMYYGCTCIISTVFLIMFLPETHEKTFKEIEAIFNKRVIADEVKSPLDPDNKARESIECKES